MTGATAAAAAVPPASRPCAQVLLINSLLLELVPERSVELIHLLWVGVQTALGLRQCQHLLLSSLLLLVDRRIVWFSLRNALGCDTYHLYGS